MATGYLLAANILVWLGIGGYCLTLARRQRTIDQRVRQLEMFQENSPHD